MMIGFLFLHIILLKLPLTAQVVVSEHKRVTRIINGEPVIGRSTGYDAVRYFAAIGTLLGVAKFDVLFSEIERNFGATFCGGALITPGIVQTACHCLSYKREQDREGKFLNAWVKHSWEYKTRVYVGVNEEFGGKWSMANVDPIITQRFMVHQSCAWLPKGSREMLSHDFGWIIVDPNWDPKGILAQRVNYAPVYTEDEIKKMFDYMNSLHAVCLVVGFGRDVREMKAENKKMRHAWLVLLSRYKCLRRTLFGLPSTDLITWICLVPFPKHIQGTAAGDSGAPVSCNNLYFAVHLGSAPKGKRLGIEYFMTFESALYWAQFQNTVRFRRKFILLMKEYGEIKMNDLLRRFDQYPASIQTFYSDVPQISAWNSSERDLFCAFSIPFIIIITLIKCAGV